MSKEKATGAVEGFDSATYRKIFEFIQEEGIEPLLSLLNETDDVTLCHFLHGGKKTGFKLNSRSRMALKFLIQTFYGTSNLRDFIDFHLRCFNPHKSCSEALRSLHMVVEKTAGNIKNLDAYTENASRLERLKIFRVYFDMELKTILAIALCLIIVGGAVFLGIRRRDRK
jgi:hypothetical protein